MVDWFRRMFEVVRPDMTKNIEISIADILSQMIDECNTLPSEVLETLMTNFNIKIAKLNPSAHQLTALICTATSDRLQSHVTQYFSETIVTASGEDDLEEREKELRQCHQLIIQINKTVPSLLLNVIAVLEQELVAEDLMVRQIAVHTLGRMFAEKASGSLAAKYPSTWKTWLGRSKDKAQSMRVLWISSISPILVHHPELRADLMQAMTERLLDPDEKVRAALVQTIGNLDFETALHHLDRHFLLLVAERLRDRRTSVRSETQEALGRLYSLAYPEIENHGHSATKQFGWIPKAILDSGFSEAKSTVPLIAVFEKYILPLPVKAEDEATWVNRLLMVMKHLDDRSIKALLLRCNQMQTPHSRKPYLPFMEACESYNGGVMSEEEEKTVAKLKASLRGSATLMPLPEKASADLLTFAKANDSRIFRLLKLCMDPSTDLKTYLKGRAEAIRRIEAIDDKLVPTATALIQLSTYPIVNGNSVPTLLRRLIPNGSQWRDSQIGTQSADSLMSMGSVSSLGGSQQPATMASLTDAEAFRSCAARTLSYISKFCPDMYTPHIGELVRLLTEEGDAVLSETVLKALCSIKRAGQAVTLDKRAVERIVRYVKHGSALQAKYGARLLCLLENSQPAAERAIDETLVTLGSRLSKGQPKTLVADLYAVGQFFKHAPKASRNVWDDMVRDVLKGLSEPWPVGAAESYDPDDDWIEDDRMEGAVKAKLVGLDVLCKRGIAGDTGNPEKSNEMAIPVFRLLFKTLELGEPRELGTPAPVKARLRLQAALCVLKLALLPSCDRAIQNDFINLALVVQDPSFQVRSRFLHKLLMHLNASGNKRRLSTRWNAIPFMAAIDPEDENRDMVLTWATRAKTLPAEERLKKIELTFCRYIHLLSHHPDFSRDSVEALREFIPYVQFYLDCAATEANIGLLFYLAGRLKTVRDSQSQGASESLYTLSELTQLVVKHKAAKQNWRLEQFPGSFKVPGDTGLKPLPSQQAQKDIYETVWLPAAVSEGLEAEIAKAEKKRSGLSSGGGSSSIVKKRKSPSSGGVPRRKKSPAEGDSKPKKKKKRGAANDEDASASEDSGSDNEEDNDAGVVSSDEAISDGEAEGRGARIKAQAKERNRKRAERRARLAQKKSKKTTGGKKMEVDDDDEELTDLDSD